MRNRLRSISTLLCLPCAILTHAQQSQPAATVPNPAAGTTAAVLTGAVPNVIRFSGSFRPTNGTPAQPVAAQPVESLTLSVYRDQTGGTPLWQETQNVAVDSERKYSVLMGATQNDGVLLDLLSAGEPRWLGVQFNRPGEAEQPRVLMTSVPYALKSVDAETLGGKPASAYLLAPSGTSASSNLASNAVATMASGTTTAPAHSTTVLTTTTAAKPRTISGQQGYVPYFTDASNDLGDSVIQQANGFVGIGTAPGAGSNTTPSLDLRTYPFSQIGMAQTVDYLTFFASDAYGPAIYWDPTKDLRLGKGGDQLYGAFGFVEQMRVQSSTGNVGIGTQSPTSKLDVNGNINFSGSVLWQGAPVLQLPGGTNQSNLALGIGALVSNTSGTSNTATGFKALQNNTSGNSNTASGYEALENNAGNSNTATGAAALLLNNTGSDNTASGVAALENNTTGQQNTAIGSGALANFSTTSSNTAVGYQALQGSSVVSANTGSFNTANGATALQSNTIASGNTATGASALQFNTTGGFNTASGYSALQFNIEGAYNTASGWYALQNNTTGNLNTATGVQALGNYSTTNGNTAVGYEALEGSSVVSANTGSVNTAVGFTALAGNTTGSNNVAIGQGALVYNTGGSSNIAIGGAAALNVFGSNSFNIHIGSPGSSGDDGTIRIGDPRFQTSFFVAGVNNVNLGGDTNAVGVLIDTTTGQLGTVSSSRRYKEDIEDMGEASHDLMRLRPVTFRYKKPFADGSKPIQYGLIAEEVDEVYPDLVAHSADGQIETVKYQVLDSMLLNEVQRQQAEIGAQKEQVRRLEQQNASLLERLDKLEAVLGATSRASGVAAVR